MDKKIAFLGTPNFAVPILKSIHQSNYKISCVFSQPPRKSNRGHKLNKSPIHLLAEELGIEIKTPENIEKEIYYIKSLNLDLAIVVAYGQILSKDILSLSKNGFINIHASLLPKWRGAAPIQRSLINMDKITGLSIMKINPKLDEGPVCNKYPLDILENENAEGLAERLSNLAAEKILTNIENILQQKANFEEQDSSMATYAKKIEKIESKINWNNGADEILAKINGLYPQPGAWFGFENNRHKILRATLSKTTMRPGEIIDDELTISCGDKSIKVTEIQREGKKPQKTRDFLLGSKLKKGIILKNE
jgi:methionyl-tRNA formyltransferase